MRTRKSTFFWNNCEGLVIYRSSIKRMARSNKGYAAHPFCLQGGLSRCQGFIPSIAVYILSIVGAMQCILQFHLV